MSDNSEERVWNGLRRVPGHEADNDLRLDAYGYPIERRSFEASNSFGWRVADGEAIGNLVGKLPAMG